MGYLTTFTIYNDDANEIAKDPKNFVDEIMGAISKGKVARIGSTAKVQKTRHSSDETIYVHSGNTVCEMNSYSDDTESLMRNSPEFFKDMLDVMESQVKQLKSKFKDINEG
jgi:hypothetical protein